MWEFSLWQVLRKRETKQNYPFYRCNPELRRKHIFTAQMMKYNGHNEEVYWLLVFYTIHRKFLRFCFRESRFRVNESRRGFSTSVGMELIINHEKNKTQDWIVFSKRESNIGVIYSCLINLQHYNYKFGNMIEKFENRFCSGLDVWIRWLSSRNWDVS